MRFIATLCLAALVPLLAACGGGSGAGAGAEGVVPADVAVYLSVDTDFDGEGWATVEELAARFPGGENFLEKLTEDIASEEEGIDFERDVRPALGSELVVAMLETGSWEAYGDAAEASEEPAVVLLQPEDPAAFDRLVTKFSEPVATREIEGWQALAESEETLDRFAAALEEGRLADSDAFEEAMDGLEEDALVRGYVSGRAFAPVEAVPDPALESLAGAVDVAALGFAGRAEEDGVRVDGRLVPADDGESPFSAGSFEPELPEEVPGDVLAYLSFGDLEGVISGYRDLLAESDPEAESQLGLAEGVLGVSIEEDLAPLFSEEGALYVRRGALVPEVTLVTRVEDEEEALATLDRLVEGAGAFGLPVPAPAREDVEGVEARVLDVSPQVELVYAAFDGLLVVTSSREGVAGLRSDEERLADDESFREATDRAGVPDETTGFGYVDLGEAVPFVLGYAAADDANVDEARPYLDPLESLVLYGDEDDGTASFTVFLGVD